MAGRGLKKDTPQGPLDPIVDSRLRKRITELIAAVFSKYGYDEVRLSTVETRSKFKRCELRPIEISGLPGDLVLRPDLTALTAYKVIEEQMITRSRFCRLFYIGDCFRIRDVDGEDTKDDSEWDEICQIGLEFLNSCSQRADAEAMLIAIDVLHTLGLRNWKLKIGNSRFLMELLTRIGMNGKFEIMTDLGWLTGVDDNLLYICRNRKRAALCALNRKLRKRLLSVFGDDGIVDCGDETIDDLISIAQRLRDQIRSQYVRRWKSVYSITDALARSLLNLLDKKGPDYHGLLLSVAREFKGCAPAEMIRMEEVYDTLASRLSENGVDLTRACELDLCLSRPPKYYTGIIFNVYYETPLGMKPVCGGGRYDTLIEEVSREMAEGMPGHADQHRVTRIDVPATGFAFELKGLAELLTRPRVEDVIRSMGRLDTECRIMIRCPPDRLADSDKFADALRNRYNVTVVQDTMDIGEAEHRERAHPDGYGLYVEMTSDPPKEDGKRVKRTKELLSVTYLRRDGAGIIEPGQKVSLTSENIENVLRVLGYARRGDTAGV